VFTGVWTELSVAAHPLCGPLDLVVRWAALTLRQVAAMLLQSQAQ
jgi:hypothetical protein